MAFQRHSETFLTYKRSFINHSYYFQQKKYCLLWFEANFIRYLSRLFVRGLRDKWYHNIEKYPFLVSHLKYIDEFCFDYLWNEISKVLIYLFAVWLSFFIWTLKNNEWISNYCWLKPLEGNKGQWLLMSNKILDLKF